MTLAMVAVAWLLTYLLHSTILLGGAWLLSVTGVVRSPVARDTLWKVCLVGGIVTASVQSAFPNAQYSAHYWLPSVTRAAQVAVPVPAQPAAAAFVAPVRVVASARPAARGPTTLSHRSQSSGLKPAAVSSPTPYTLPPTPSLSWPSLLLGLWMLGAAALLVRLLICRLRLARQLGRRREITDGPLAEMLESLRAAAGVRRRIRLTASAELAGPVAMGASEICLPERAVTSLSPAEQRAVLAHELGHLVRKDPSWLTLSVAIETLLFLQPLNRLARRQVQQAAEYLCDDWAVHQTGGSLTLAKCLAEVAAWMESAPRAVPISGMAENRSHLVERVQRLVNGAEPRAVRGLRLAVPVAALALSSVAFAAPGISPPCDQDAPQAASLQSRARAARPATQAQLPGGPRAWARIRDGRVLEFRSGFASRITGQGHLGIRRGGRAIELGDGQRLLVNGRPVDDGVDVTVCETDTLGIVDEQGRSQWRIVPVRLSPEEMRAVAEGGSEESADLALDRLDSLGESLDSMQAELDDLDTVDVEAMSRSVEQVSERVTREVNLRLVPKVAQIQRMGLRIGAEMAPRLAEMGVRIAASVVPMIANAFCESSPCDSGSAPVKRHKSTFKPHR